MTDRHLDEGLIQTYIDGELSQEETHATAQHLAACEVCSKALAEAEGETAFFAKAFAPDESLNVPTASLRVRLNAAVAQVEASEKPRQQHSQDRSLGALFASLSSLFTPRAAAAFAALLVAVVAGIIYLSSQRSRPTNDAPQVAGTHPTNTPAPLTPKPEVVTPEALEPPVKKEGPTPYVMANHAPRSNRRRPAAQKSPKVELLPGEQEYRAAIASLEKTIKLGGDETLRPVLRADYERNLALLDSAITQTRQVAAGNPKDKDAVGFLMAAYQSKVELLTRVADQAQVAALGR